jgi:hypothetical protein
MHRALVLVLSAVALWGCPKKEEVRVEVPPPAPRLPESPKTPVGMAVPPDAEVEVIGTWRSGVKAAQHVAVIGFAGFDDLGVGVIAEGTAHRVDCATWPASTRRRAAAERTALRRVPCASAR